MCGICGIFGEPIDGDAQEQRRRIVTAMTARLAHRGPDGEGLASGPTFALGHRRLAIIDPEHGQQPLASPDNRAVLTYNGEVYNYVELRQELTRQGVGFQTFCDTEVLLAILMRQGIDALTRLNGMFAFALVERETGQWLIARDPFGVKPLHYAQVNGQLVFASEIKGLLEHPSIRARVDEHALEQYITFQFCLGGRTLFDGIHTLEAGCCMTGRHGQIDRIHRYWDTNYEIDEYHTAEYFVDRLLMLLEDSVRLQVRSDVPLGAHLSGGIDSSTIASLAADCMGPSMKLFHGRFGEGPQYDESAYAERVAASLGGKLELIEPSAHEFVEDLPRLIDALDEPMAGPGLFPQFRVSRLAADHVKVVLGGQGGDEIFCGYARYLVGYLEQAIKGAVFQTQEEGRHIVSLESIIPNLPLLREYRPLMQHFWQAGLFEPMDARYFRLIDRSPVAERILSPDVRARFDRGRVFEAFSRIFNHADTHSYVNKMTHFDLKTLLPALLHIEDRVSMAVSLESRVPMLDTRIVDLVTAMPPAIKFEGGRTKHVLKQAVRSIIPAEVRQRRDKMGFPVPLREWMSGGPVRDFVCDTLNSRACRERGLFDTASVDALLDVEAAFGRQLWGALCLELWHQRFIDGQGSSAA